MIPMKIILCYDIFMFNVNHIKLSIIYDLFIFFAFTEIKEAINYNEDILEQNCKASKV